MKKIGEIKGVPVVEGDANLVKDQILYKETDKGISLSKRTNGKLEEVSGGNSNNDIIHYYKMNSNINEDDLSSLALLVFMVSNTVLIENKNISISMAYQGKSDTYFEGLSSYFKYKYGDNYYFNYDKLKGFSVINDAVTIPAYLGSFMEFTVPSGDFKNKLLSVSSQMEVPESGTLQFLELFDKCFTKITKEEYESMLN